MTVVAEVAGVDDGGRLYQVSGLPAAPLCSQAQLVFSLFVVSTFSTTGPISWYLLSPNRLHLPQASSCLTITMGITNSPRTSTLAITTSQKITFSGSSRLNLHGASRPPLCSFAKPSSQRVWQNRLWLKRWTLSKRRRVNKKTQRSRLKRKCPGAIQSFDSFQYTT